MVPRWYPPIGRPIGTPPRDTHITWPWRLRPAVSYQSSGAASAPGGNTHRALYGAGADGHPEAPDRRPLGACPYRRQCAECSPSNFIDSLFQTVMGWVSPRNTRLRGQGAIEYVLVIAIIVLVVMIAGPWVSSAIRNQFNTVAGVLVNGTAGGTWEPSGSGSGNGAGSATVQAALAKDAKDTRRTGPSVSRRQLPRTSPPRARRRPPTPRRRPRWMPAPSSR